MKVGVIGLGRAGIKHAGVYFRMPGVELAAVCDLDAGRSREAGARFGCGAVVDYRELLRDGAIDAVSIALPDDCHLEASRAAVAAGKHVLLEKPLASTLADGLAIRDLAAGYRRTFMVGHTLRFDPRHAMARDSIAAGEIGELIHVSCRRNSTIAGARMYRGHTDTHIHLMIHDADYINWIAGARPRSVFARSREVLLKGWGMHDTIIALLSYDNGLLACIEACWVLPANSPTRLDDKMEIVGTRGALYLDSCDAGLHVVCEGRVEFPDSIHWPEVNGETGGTFYEEISHFVGCAASGRRPIVGAEEGLAALQVVDAIERSLRQGREVEIGAGK
jgi:predicted dehydrogenase